MHGEHREHRMDTKSRLNTEGNFYLGLNYTSEETCDPSSRPCEQNAATWKPLTVTGGDDKPEIGLHVGLGRGSWTTKSQKGIQTQLYGQEIYSPISKQYINLHETNLDQGLQQAYILLMYVYMLTVQT